MSSIVPAVVTGLAFLVALKRLPALHPLQPWAGAWAVSTLLYAFRLLPYRHLSVLTAALICGAVLAFAIGVPAGARAAAWRAPSGLATSEARSLALAARLLMGLMLVTLAVYLAQLMSLFGVASVLTLAPAVKLYVSNGAGPISSTYVNVAVAAAVMCGIVAAITVVPRVRMQWLLAAAGCAATVYFSTSRGFIVVALIAALAALGMSWPNINWPRIMPALLVTGLVLLTMYIGLGSLLGKTYGNSTIDRFDNFFSTHPAVSSLALPYQDLSADIPALDLLVRASPTWGVAHGCATAPIACGVVRKLGVAAPRVPVAGPFTMAPLQWNGYTFLDRFLIDGGTALTLLLVALTGAVAGFFWARARAGSTVGIIVYAIGFPALVAAYRQNLLELAFVSSVLGVAALLVARVVVRHRFRRSIPPKVAIGGLQTP